MPVARFPLVTNEGGGAGCCDLLMVWDAAEERNAAKRFLL
jgi:hypothetical protein